MDRRDHAALCHHQLYKICSGGSYNSTILTRHCCCLVSVCSYMFYWATLPIRTSVRQWRALCRRAAMSPSVGLWADRRRVMVHPNQRGNALSSYTLCLSGHWYTRKHSYVGFSFSFVYLSRTRFWKELSQICFKSLFIQTLIRYLCFFEKYGCYIHFLSIFINFGL